MSVYWRWGESSVQHKEIFDKSTKSDKVQFGATNLFMRKGISQALETLREIRMRKIDDASTKIQATFRMHQTKSQLALFYKSVGRMQAAFRGIHYREKWCKYRQAISIVQWFFKGFILKTVIKQNRKRYESYNPTSVSVMGITFHADQAWIAGFTWIVEKFIVRRHVLQISSCQNYTKCHPYFSGLDVYIGQG